MDSSTNSMYSVAPTIYKDDSPDPVKLYLDGIAEDKASLEAAKAKRQLDGAKRMDAANKAATSLKVTGWRNHDEIRKAKQDEIQGGLTTLFTEYDGAPFEGKDGQLRYSEFNQKINDYNMFEEYSKQIQAETEASIAEARDNPNLYTQESLDNLNNYVNSDYAYQAKEGLPILEKVEPEVDALDYLFKTNRPGSKSYQSSKPTEEGTRSSSGTSVPYERVLELDGPVIDKWHKAKNSYWDSLYSLYGRDWEREAEAKAYDNTDESIDETGYNEMEREELKYVKGRAVKAHQATFPSSSGSTITKSKTKSGDNLIPSGGTVTSPYIDRRFGGGREGNTVDATPLEGKAIQINPASYIETDQDNNSVWKGANQTQMTFVPGKMYSGVYVFQGPGNITVGDVELFPGDMIPPGSFNSLPSDSKDRFNQENVVEGTVKQTVPAGENDLDSRPTTTIKTIRVREKDVKTSGFAKPLESGEFDDILGG